MLVLGLSGYFSREDAELAPAADPGFFHDAAACLIRDGELVVAVEEERFNRIKKTSKFPINAIRACLATSGVSPSQIDAVGHYFAEYAVDASLDLIYLNNPQLPLRSSRELITEYLQGDLGFQLGNDELIYAQHHLSHAMSSFIRSGLTEALVVVMDGRGEAHSITIFHGSGGVLKRLAAYGLDKSLGDFYESCIQLLSYRMGDEYKVMGLAPYGNPDTYRSLFSSMYEMKDDGELDIGLHMENFLAYGLKPRRKGEDFTQQHMDFAAGLQQALERMALHVITHWAQRTGVRDLCFVGGVAHNSSLNGLLLQTGTFREVFVHPVSHDAGSAEGAALIAAQRLGAPPLTLPRMRTASVGPDLGSDSEIERELAGWGDVIEYERPADVVESAAHLLADGAVIGWAQGRSEYGPRALGNRSILADARPGANKDRINAMVKKRESYRPFAPAVTAEAAEQYFDLPDTAANYDFMSFVVDVLPDRRAELGAVTHVDGSARVQIVDAAASPRFHRLIQRFGEITGTPVVLNTSFNNFAEPIVQTVRDALTCYLTTELDVLVVEDFLVHRRPGPPRPFGGLVLQLRPVARVSKRIRTVRTGVRETCHELYLDHPAGSRTEVTDRVFALLEAADGTQTLDELAAVTGVPLDGAMDELYGLWQQRFFHLLPRA
jgi:decarbamoylnovobiocin carbamoyltransferase/7-O-carbamoyltransferase